jgi:hypothetical protein
VHQRKEVTTGTTRVWEDYAEHSIDSDRCIDSVATLLEDAYACCGGEIVGRYDDAA